jgi:hypothetical protein
MFGFFFVGNLTTLSVSNNIGRDFNDLSRQLIEEADKFPVNTMIKIISTSNTFPVD